MNFKPVIFIFLLIKFNECHAAENVTSNLTNNFNQTENNNLSDKTNDVPTNNHAEKRTSSPEKEEPGFINKLSNLIFGSGEDAQTSETRQIPQYGPPPPPNKGYQQNCNPCNKEPWIPIMTNYGQNTLHGYVQPHDINNGNGNNGGLYQQNIPNTGYGTPIHGNGLTSGPQDNYPQISPHVLENFKPPPQQPGVSYGTPALPLSQDLYSSSNLPKDSYGAPASNYVPPPQQGNYVPPPQQANYAPPPAPDYGAPEPLPNYQPPKPDFGPPQVEYGPPKNEYNPPEPDYGAPFQLPSNSAHPGFLNPPLATPSPTINFGNHYGLPKPIYKIPLKNYGPPINQPTYGPPKPGYHSGKSPRQIRPAIHRPHLNYGPPAPQPVYKYIPLNKGKFTNLPTNFKPPPPPSNYNPGGPIFNNFGVNQAVQPSKDIKTQITNPEYLPPLEQLPISSEHNIDPIAFPNLSSRPVAPLHNAGNFHDNFPQGGQHFDVPYDSNVQIQQSIPVADFLATIEHPINIIRSPILDLNVANTSSQSDGYYSTVSPPVVANAHQIPQTYRPSDEHFNHNKGHKLSEHPIVVDDTHAAAATNENKTAVVNNFNNLGSDEISEDFISEILKGINGNYKTVSSGNYQPTNINNFYSGSTSTYYPGSISSYHPNAASNIQISNTQTQHVENGPQHLNIGNFKGPTGTYQTPAPSTSMQPPPIGVSPWLGASTNSNPGRYIDNTTKKPKQIQIIIPYTTNNEYDKRKSEIPKQHSEVYRGSESQEVTSIAKQPSGVINIQELFKNTNNHHSKPTHNMKNLPFDVIRLQKNIDGWTEQEYSKTVLGYTKASSATIATTKLAPSKKIPEEYLTTLPYTTDIKLSSTTARSTPIYRDHEPAGSNSKEYLESNLIATTEATTTPKLHKLNKLPNWDKIHIAVSPLTKEKIYVVTPQPKTATSSWRQSRENERNSTTFSISIMPMRNKTADTNDVRVILSEWPHLINNLATTTKHTTTTPPSTSRHPLFGLMDLSSYAPPGNSTIETYSGHSKVINVATASLKKRGTAEERKVTTTMKSTTLK